MSKVPFRDGWGDEHVVQVYETIPTSDSPSIPLADLRSVLIAFEGFSKIERRVFVLLVCDEVSPTEIARQLGWKSRGSVMTVRERIAGKLAAVGLDGMLKAGNRRKMQPQIKPMYATSIGSVRHD